MASPVDLRARSGLFAPIVASDFADPSLIKVDNTWYAFGTGVRGKNKAQINVVWAKSTTSDINTLKYQDESADPEKQKIVPKDNVPAWVNQTDPNFWAPDAVRLVSEIAAITSTLAG